MNTGMNLVEGGDTKVEIVPPNRAERRSRSVRRVRQSHFDKQTVALLLPHADKMNLSRKEKPKNVKHGEPYSKKGPLTKPYAIVAWQKKIDKREAKIRTLPHDSPQRARLAEEVRAMKKRLGQ